jgi:hypothetical protein
MNRKANISLFPKFKKKQLREAYNLALLHAFKLSLIN